MKKVVETKGNAKITIEQETNKHFPEHGPIADNGKEILVSLKHVDIFFGKKEKQVKAAKDVSFDIYKGETFSLVGESGSGKTTVGRAILRVNECTNGEIFYKGVKISGPIPKTLDREVIRNIQMIFQDPAACLNERATVEYIISEGLYNFHLYETEAERYAKVENVIKEVGLLPEHLTRYPHEFSGGQRQRIGIARAIVMEPEFIVADEPISALDVSIRAQVLNLLKKFQKEKSITYLFIAHDLSVVRYISDRIGVIYKGTIVEIATAEELFNYPLHPYTKSLISAIPVPDPKLEKRKVLYVYNPSMHDYSTEQPALTDIGHGHYIYGNSKEISEYKKIREKNVPLQAINISDTELKETTFEEQYENVGSILDIPVHDNGSLWYAVISALCFPLGIILAIIFKKKKYFRCYKKCIQGLKIIMWFAIAIIGIFALALLYASIG